MDQSRAQVSAINGNVRDTENGNNVFAGHHCPVSSVSCSIEVPTEMVTAAYKLVSDTIQENAGRF